jgi:PAS domain S-box-containing protein
VFQENKGWANRSVIYLIVISGIIAVFAIALNNITTSHINFAVQFNVYALVSFFSAFIDLVTILIVILKKRFSFTTAWLLLFLGAAALMALAEGLQRLSIHPSAALFWQDLYYVGLSGLPLSFYLFIVSFTGHYKKQFIFLTALLIIAWGVVAFFSGEGLFFTHALPHIHKAPWGYYSLGTIDEEISAAWFSLIYIFGYALLLQYWKNTKNMLLRKQIMTVLLAFFIPFAVAIITSQILPSVLPGVIPPLATLIGAFSGLVIYYSIFRFHLFEIDAQALAQNILATMSEAVIITKPDLTIDSVNNEAARLLGIKPESANSEKLESFFSVESWQYILLKINNQTDEETLSSSDSQYVKSADGKLTPIRISVSSMEAGGERIANIIVASDITEITRSYQELRGSAEKIFNQNNDLTKLEAQLREEKANVEKIVLVRTKALFDAQERLKAADQLKTEFVMLTSHNLRTPLAIAKGYTEIIASKAQLSEEDKPLFDGLRVGLDRLSKIVEDLLTISSIESGAQLALEEVPFGLVIDPLIKESEDLSRTCTDKFVVNQHAGDVRIKANIERLQGALRNVLDNAFKFTENGTIELNTSRSENELIINITDTGIGLDITELPKLFTKFHRAASALNGNYEGKGIGLYLSKLIIEEHGGRISVVSKPNQGSTFTIQIPCI